MKKIRALALIPLIAITLTACTLQDLPLIGGLFGGTTGNEPVTLNVWGLWEDPEALQVAFDAYTAEHPNVTINYDNRSIMTPREYKERIFTRFQGENSDIDVALVHASWVSRLSPFLASMPQEKVSTEEYESRYYPVMVQNGVVDNQIKAMPAYYDGLALVYNKAHFEEINQNTPPVAWEEFRRLALELTIRNGNSLVRGGAAIGTADNIDHFSDILSLMWAQADVGVTESMRSRSNYGSGEYYNNLISQLDSKPAYDALEFYTNFVREDGVWSSEFPEATTAFAQGDVSMIFIPSWKILDLYAVMPDTSVIGVATVPQIIESDPRAWGSFWMWSVAERSPYSAQALDLINFLAQDAQYQAISSKTAEARFFSSPYASVELSSEISNPVLTPYLEMAPYARTSEFAGRAGNSTQVDPLRDAVNAVLKGTQPKNALTTLKNTLSN